jgi:ATP-binding cassette subfamily B protein
MNKQNEFAKKIKRKSMISNVYIILNIIFGTIPSFIVVYMVGKLSKNSLSIQSIILCGVLIVVSLSIKALFYWLSMWKAHDAAYGVLTDMRVDIINHLKKMPLGFFQKRKTGDLCNIINYDVEQTELYLAHAMPEIMSATFIPVIAFIIITIIDWRMGIAIISTAPLMFLSRRLLNRLWAGLFKHFFDSTRKMSEDLIEYISTIPVIKAFSREEQKTKSVLGTIQKYIHWVKKMLISISVPMGIITMFLEGGLVVMIIVGSILLSNGDISTERFVLALILGGIFSTSFAKLTTFQHYKVVFNQAAANIASILGVKLPKKSNRYDNVSAGDIKIENVSFSYTDKKERTLSNINLVFKENTVNAIVGASGSGKSTLANLVMGFWEPSSGKIYINDIDIADMREEALAELVSIVQQEVFLFNLSIEENIKIGKPDATHEEVIKAAKRAQIHQFISSLPQGYDTLAGEAGVKLSGGEKQRISIARMMLKNAPIIILDEATAAIDPCNEHLIQKAIKSLGKDKTIITIAHHLNTIKSADQIIVMDEGSIVDRGSHEKLLSTCSIYKEMVEKQQKVDDWQIKEEAV